MESLERVQRGRRRREVWESGVEEMRLAVEVGVVDWSGGSGRLVEEMVEGVEDAQPRDGRRRKPTKLVREDREKTLGTGDQVGLDEGGQHFYRGLQQKEEPRKRRREATTLPRRVQARADTGRSLVESSQHPECLGPPQTFFSSAQTKKQIWIAERRKREETQRERESRGVEWRD